MKKLILPEKIKIKIVRNKDSGTYVAELTEYNIHTEADSQIGLDCMINDLIYAYFDVPKEYWGKIIYREKVVKPEPCIDISGWLSYQKFLSSEIAHL